MSIDARVANACVGARRVIVALSGGADSTALLLAAHGACAASGQPLRALHVDHGLVAAAADWQRHCRQLTATLGVPLDIARVLIATGGNLEARAREARYGAFARALVDGDVLLLGHQRDDQAETVLLRLLRGTGADGLAGIPRRRPLGQGTLLRPLLDVSSHELRVYLQERGIGHVTDPMNADTRLDRSYLRRVVLPLLRARWPGADATLARVATNIADEGQLRASLLQPLVDAAVDADGGLRLSAIAGHDGAVRRAILRAWLARFDVRTSRAQVVDLDQQLHSAGHRQLMWTVAAAEVHRHRGVAHVLRSQTGDAALAVPAGQAARLPASGQRPMAVAECLWLGDAPMDFAGGRLSCRAVTRGLRWPEHGVVVRCRRGGERLRPHGHAHHRRLQALLREAGTPPWSRPTWPLLYVGDELICIPGIATAAGWQAAPGVCVDYTPPQRAHAGPAAGGHGGRL